MRYYFTFCFLSAIVAIVVTILITPYRRDIREDLNAISNELADIKQDVKQTRIRVESLIIQIQINETRVKENIKKTEELTKTINELNGEYE